MTRSRLIALVPAAMFAVAALAAVTPSRADAQFGETGMRNTYLGVCTNCWYLDWPYSNCDCEASEQT